MTSRGPADFAQSFLLFSGYLVNRLYDTAKKVLFFVENADLEEYVGFLTRTRLFRDISSEIVHWRVGFRRMQRPDRRLELARKVSVCLDSFTRIFSKTDFLKDFPVKPEGFKKLSKLRKAPIDSIKEINQFDFTGQSNPPNAVFVTFNDLGQSESQIQPQTETDAKTITTCERPRESTPAQRAQDRDADENSRKGPSFFHLTFSEMPETTSQSLMTPAVATRRPGDCRESKVTTGRT